MNTTLDNSFEPNLRDECNSGSKYNYKELVNLLHSDNLKEKHFAVLELNKINSQNDAKILVSNLVGQDGKIREAVAFKINELSQNPNYIDLFTSEEIFDTLLQGIMDINGNVCRQIVGNRLIESSEFKNYLCEKLPKSINEILKEIEKIDSNTKKYVVSKRNFQLYWCLEALYKIIDNIQIEKIREILLKTGKFYDYTIREKTAKILTKIDNSELNELKEKLKNDENYYVKRFLKE